LSYSGTTTNVNLNNNDPLVIGAYNQSTTQSGFHDGIIDDLRIYNRALSTDEVKRLYQMGKTTRIGVNTPNVSLDTGLVGHWTFNGPDTDWSSTTAEIRDRSGNSNHANATTSAMSSSTIPGVIGQALKFGSGAYSVSQVPYSANLQPTSAISYGGWFEFYATTGSTYILNQQAKQSPFTGWILEIYNGRLGATIHTATTWHSASTSITGVISLGEWYHVFATYSAASSESRLYLNGALVSTEPLASGDVVYNGNLTLCLSGDRYSTSTCGYRNFFNGAMDDIRVYNRELSADEVQRLYQLGR
jgi:hypothetical protein